jgi:hypothetical protein
MLFSENEWVSAVTIMVRVINIRMMWFQSLLRINWISCPQAVHAVFKEQIRCGLLNQSHDSLESFISGGSWISMSCSFDNIDVISEGHFTSQSEEDSLVFNPNFETSSGVVSMDFNPRAKYSLIR